MALHRPKLHRFTEHRLHFLCNLTCDPRAFLVRHGVPSFLGLRRALEATHRPLVPSELRPTTETLALVVVVLTVTEREVFAGSDGGVEEN